MFHGICLTVLTVLVACGPTPARVTPTPSGGVNVNGGTELGWATKRVLTKQEPETLLAQDGTICRVTTDRFKNTKVGQDVACNWQPGNPAR